MTKNPRVARRAARFRACVCLGILLTLAFASRAEDWPMLGRDKTRNAVSPEKGAPVEWDIKSGRNIKWRAPVGNITWADPVIADGLVWIGTTAESNDAPVLKCFRERDGSFVWRMETLATNGLPRGRGSSACTTPPLIEGDRAWLTTRYGQVLCLKVSSLSQEASAPRIVWTLDMHQSLGVWPFYSVMSGGETCSIGASYGNRIYVITGNGIRGWAEGESTNWLQVRAPDAPSLVCLDKNSGKVFWQDNSPGTNILYGQWGSPLVADVGGHGQVIAPLGDGWVRSFDALTGELLWKLNINFRSATNRNLRNHFLNAPVLYKERVFIGGGNDLGQGEGPGSLFCIDPTRRGDVSLELDDGPGKGKPNPNSAVFWHLPSFGRALGQVAIDDNLVIAVGFDGLVHCLDARTGHEYWRHDMRAHVLGSPLIVDRKIYVGDEDGDVCVIELAREKRLLFATAFDSSVYSSPIFANGVLYITTDWELFAIQQGASSPPRSATKKP